TVAPGTYTLRLTSGDKVAESECKVLPDPRLGLAAKDYEQQQVMLSQVEDAVRDIHESVNRLRTVKTQLKSRMDLLKQMEGLDELVEKGEQVQKSISEWEKNLIQPDSKTFQDVINFKNQLNSELLIIKNVLDAHDPRPTSGAKIRLAETLQSWVELKADMERIIIEEVGGFNSMYAEKNLPILIIPKKEKTIRP
ncbi:MAG: glycosyl hydrolase, partial [Bacteroidia bacterium]|nr:glycosyl hydrolase [Bacteroidia bacterium]